MLLNERLEIDLASKTRKLGTWVESLDITLMVTRGFEGV